MFMYIQLIDDDVGKSNFRIVYESYKGLMYSVAFRVLQNRQDAEDALQDAFISIAKNICKISDPHSNQTKGYVITITENKAIDIYRSKVHDQTLPLDESYVGQNYDFNTTSELADAMKRLPDRYRQALILHFYCGYSVESIAAMLNMKYEAARKLVYRAKQRLSSELEKEGAKV